MAKSTWNRDDIIAALAKIADDLIAGAEELRQLDAAIGDGDLGITVTLGSQAVREQLLSLGEADISTILKSTGMAFNRKAASTFGALYATMMMRAAHTVTGLTEIGVDDLAAMADAAVQGVRDRGHAEAGDKTMLDALVPLSLALSAAAREGEPLAAAISRAAAAAKEGAQATIEMRSRTGRSSWFADRTQGVQDPGATAIYVIVRSLQDFVHST